MKTERTHRSVCSMETKNIVDRVLDVQGRAATKHGGVGLRYKACLSCEEDGVYGKITYIYLEKGVDPEIWFVEAR